MALRLEKTPPTNVYNPPASLSGISISIPRVSGAALREAAGLPPVPRTSGGSRFGRAVRRATSNVTRVVSDVGTLPQRAVQNVSRVGEQVAEEVTSLPGNVVEILEETAEAAGEIGQEVIDVAKGIVGAEGLTTREIANALDLAGSVQFVIDGVVPWLEKVTLYADQLETLPLAQVRGAGRSQVGTLLNTLGLEIVEPPALPGQPGVLQSPIGQVVTVGVSFVPGFGQLISAGIGAVGAIASAFGRRETEKRQKQLQARVVAINAALQKELNRSVQMLGFLGDPDALDVLGVVPELQATIAGEKRATRFSPVLPIIAVGGAALLAVTALSGHRSRPAILGRAAVGLSGLDPTNNLGLPELTRLIEITNQLEDENDRLVALLLEIEVGKESPPAGDGVQGFDTVTARSVAVPAILGIASLALIGAAIART